MFSKSQVGPWGSIPVSSHTWSFPPVRNPITRSSDHFRAKVRCPRSGRIIRCESLLERKALNLLLFTRNTGAISHQPCTVSFELDGRNRRYTPDFCMEMPGGGVSYFEVKPFDIAHTRDVRRFHNAAYKSFKAAGSKFYVITERHLQRIGVTDIQRLLELRNRWHVEHLGGPPIDESLDAVGASIWHEFPALQASLDRGCSITFSRAVELLGGGPDAVKCVLILLTTRHLAWPVRKALTYDTKLHQYTEADDEELFV